MAQALPDRLVMCSVVGDDRSAGTRTEFQSEDNPWMFVVFLVHIYCVLLVTLEIWISLKPELVDSKATGIWIFEKKLLGENLALAVFEWPILQWGLQRDWRCKKTVSPGSMQLTRLLWSKFQPLICSTIVPAAPWHVFEAFCSSRWAAYDSRDLFLRNCPFICSADFHRSTWTRQFAPTRWASIDQQQSQLFSISIMPLSQPSKAFIISSEVRFRNTGNSLLLVVLQGLVFSTEGSLRERVYSRGAGTLTWIDV